VEAAVKDAVSNAANNGITNTRFISGDMAKILTPDFEKDNGRPRIIVTDPPRAGMHPSVVASILEIRPEIIVYVSCNPATQARDIALMMDSYNVLEIQPIDMFPHTHHVENIVILKNKK
jgi:23S rRNA (uracil1939-C5)-methyltransferase